MKQPKAKLLIEVVKYYPNCCEIGEPERQIVECKDTLYFQHQLAEEVDFIKNYRGQHEDFKYFIIKFNTMDQMILVAVRGIYPEPPQDKAKGWSTAHPDDYERPAAWLNYINSENYNAKNCVS